MVDKMGNLAIIISATPLNKFGEEPDTGALSQIFANLTKYIFGVDLPAQTPDYSKVSRPRIVTDALIERVVLFITKNRQAGPGADTPKPALTRANPEVAMADKNIPPIKGIVKFPDLDSILNFPNTTDSASGQNPGNLTNLSEAEVSSLLDLVQSQIEFHRDELARLKPFLHQLQTRIPTDSFQEFINTLE